MDDSCLHKKKPIGSKKQIKFPRLLKKHIEKPDMYMYVSNDLLSNIMLLPYFQVTIYLPIHP